MMRPIETLWFTAGNSCIGIVLALDDITQEPKAYVGCGNGINECADTQKILDRGAKVYPSQAKRLAEHLHPEAK